MTHQTIPTFEHINSFTTYSILINHEDGIAEVMEMFPLKKNFCIITSRLILDNLIRWGQYHYASENDETIILIADEDWRKGARERLATP